MKPLAPPQRAETTGLARMQGFVVCLFLKCGWL